MSQVMRTFRKDPEAIIPFGFDLSDWLATGSSITTSSWTIIRLIPDSQDGITLTGDDDQGSTTTLIWLSGGVAGEKYLLTNTFTASDNEKDQRSFILAIEDR